MKTKMKMFAAIALAMGFVSGAMAADGQTANGSIQGKATVLVQVKVAKVSDLYFSNVTPGINKTINLDGSVSAGITTGGEEAGQFTITKAPNTQVTLAFTTLPVELSGLASTPTEGLKLPISYTAQLSKDATVVHPITIPEDGVVVANSSTTKPYFETNEFQLDLGGTVKPATNQTAGAYEADITLTATYN